LGASVVGAEELFVITAIVLIQAEADTIPEAAQSIADIDGVTAVYSCAGDVDLIAMVKVAAHDELADLVPGKISKVPGVINTDTHIAFREYSRTDTEATFGIGMDG
jgi:DNA-binding Lrp family transcriptional regulator